ncbi:MAG: glucose-1-phosphate cytidylyltransferase [Planctomycetes bacterium]|nr:glucose-1-phosphate cytidylyltransferase [Planctomycetota bacterium]
MTTDQRREQVVILCGGRGTRLQEETEFKPKALVEIGGRPILWHLMRIYDRYGFRRFVLCLGYKGNLIKEYFLQYSAMQNDFTLRLRSGERRIHGRKDVVEDWEITFADTGLDTNTGGRLHRIAHLIDQPLFLANYCDGLSDIDLDRLVAFHRDKGKIATVTGFHPHSRFGIVKVDDSGIVNYWQEKPLMSDLTSGGFFVFERGIFDYLDADCVLEQQPLERLSADRQLALYPHDGYWQCMDTFKEALALNRLWASGNAPWRTWDDD